MNKILTNTERLLEVAKKYLNAQELKGNVFKDDTELGRRLHAAGQQDGEAWCAYLQEVIFVEAFPEAKAWLEKLFSANAVKTFENFVAAGCKHSMIPQVGDLCIFQRYKNGDPTSAGHAGLVINVQASGAFVLFEGNTNLAGSREGTTALMKDRKNIRTDNGLNILGFVTIYDRTK